MTENAIKDAKEPRNKGVWWLPSILIFFKMSVWIAFPIIVALYVGDWLDSTYNQKSKWLLISVGIAFVISMVGLAKTTVEEWKKLDLSDKKDEKNSVIKTENKNQENKN
jgi:hypothetical protein